MSNVRTWHIKIIRSKRRLIHFTLLTKKNNTLKLAVFWNTKCSFWHTFSCNTGPVETQYRRSVDNNYFFILFHNLLCTLLKIYLKYWNFLEVFAANYFSITETLFGMSPDLIAVVLVVGNGTRSESSDSPQKYISFL